MSIGLNSSHCESSSHYIEVIEYNKAEFQQLQQLSLANKEATTQMIYTTTLAK